MVGTARELTLVLCKSRSEISRLRFSFLNGEQPKLEKDSSLLILDNGEEGDQPDNSISLSSEKSTELVAEHVVNVDVERSEWLSILSMPILGDKHMYKSS